MQLKSPLNLNRQRPPQMQIAVLQEGELSLAGWVGSGLSETASCELRRILGRGRACHDRRGVPRLDAGGRATSSRVQGLARGLNKGERLASELVGRIRDRFVALVRIECFRLGLQRHDLL